MILLLFFNLLRKFFINTEEGHLKTRIVAKTVGQKCQVLNLKFRDFYHVLYIYLNFWCSSVCNTNKEYLWTSGIASEVDRIVSRDF